MDDVFDIDAFFVHPPPWSYASEKTSDLYVGWTIIRIKWKLVQAERRRVSAAAHRLRPAIGFQMG
jgi:hypothetical protein